MPQAGVQSEVASRVSPGGLAVGPAGAAVEALAQARWCQAGSVNCRLVLDCPVIAAGGVARGTSCALFDLTATETGTRICRSGTVSLRCLARHFKVCKGMEDNIADVRQHATCKLAEKGTATAGGWGKKVVRHTCSWATMERVWERRQLTHEYIEDNRAAKDVRRVGFNVGNIGCRSRRVVCGLSNILLSVCHSGRSTNNWRKKQNVRECET